MKRFITQDLLQWKNRADRKPLILRGARQTGKTWILNQFGRDQYSNVAYIDLMDSQYARNSFEGDFDIDRILRELSLITNTPIDTNTLIILDEIQESPRALTSLKYFYQKRPELHVVAAGSYLGISKHAEGSFPVGKVDSLSLNPMSFMEFLYATNQSITADTILQSGAQVIPDSMHEKLTKSLKEYMFCGGMPEAVSAFCKTGDFAEVRRIQTNILSDYDSDFSKHIPARILERTRLVWTNLPAQLARENKKFVYGSVRPGARARDFEEAIQWLIDYGVCRKVQRVSTLRKPLKSYASLSDFKLFCVDVGLLGALAETDKKIIMEGDALFTEFKGALAEQYVCEQLVCAGLNPFYWSAERSNAEIDFAIQSPAQIIPIEVKAALNLKSKSLKSACERFELTHAVRYSLAGYDKQPTITNIPLWAAGANTE